MRARGSILLCTALLAGCVTARGPEAAAERYARALEEGRLEDAWRTLQPGEVSLEDFRARYADAAVRRSRAAQVRAGLPGLRAVAPGLEAVPAADGWRLVEPTGADGAPEAVLRAFLQATAAGDFAAAYRLLAAPLRARYTPELLARDFRAEPEARARLARAREALLQPAQSGSEGEALFPVGTDRAVRLVREGGAWRVAALE